MSDTHSGNHVLLARVPKLFVHAVLSDPALGEDAFAAYLPDTEAVRKENRSGGGRKWHTLALALHHETKAFMMVPTEEPPEKVRRKHAVLRPAHLSPRLVPNSLLKAVTAGEMHFAHAEAVADMCLASCLDACPVGTVLNCIRVALDRATRSGGGGGEGSAANGGTDENDAALDDDEGVGFESRHFQSKKLSKKKQRDLPKREASRPSSSRRPRGEAAEGTAAAECGVGTMSEETLLDVWRYLAAEHAACVVQGERGEPALRLLVEALIGVYPAPPPPLRIFPVRGSASLRLHSEHGVALCLGLAPSLAAQGPAVLRLAQRIVPQLEIERLQGVDGLEELLRFLRARQLVESAPA